MGSGAGFTFERVDVVDVRADVHLATQSAADTWPCPACDERSHVREAVEVRVRNRLGEPFERWVLVCRPCLLTAHPGTSLPRLGDDDHDLDLATS